MFPHNFIFCCLICTSVQLFDSMKRTCNYCSELHEHNTNWYACDGYLVSTVSSYQSTMLPKQVEQVFKQWEAPLFMSRLHHMHMTVLPSQLFLVIVIFFSTESKCFCWVIRSLWPIISTTFLGAIYKRCLQPFDGYVGAYFLAIVLWLFFNSSSVFVHYS